MADTDDAIRARTLQLVADYRALLSGRAWDEWIELWAEDAVLEFPLRP